MRKYAATLLVFLLIAVACIAGFKAVQYRSVSLRLEAEAKDPYHIGRYNVENQALAGTAADRVVFLGDSLTYRWQLPLTLDGLQVVNRGIGSDTTDGMVGRFRADALSLHPKAVVILAGVNDLAKAIEGDPASGALAVLKVEGNLRLMVQAAKVEGIKPVLCSAMPVNDKWGPRAPTLNTAVKSLNERLSAMAKGEGVPYLDYWSLVADGSTGALKPDLSTDGIHVNQAAYDKMLGAVRTALAQ